MKSGSKIQGVNISELEMYSDQRGWLAECYRTDEITKSVYPEMSYISMTEPQVARGPHEHRFQTDCFCFIGTSEFTLYLWDNRESSDTYELFEKRLCPEDRIIRAFVPPGVVHAYKNTGDRPGLVVNFPNKLFAGNGKKDKVDEIRHEETAGSKFFID